VLTKKEVGAGRYQPRGMILKISKSKEYDANIDLIIEKNKYLTIFKRKESKNSNTIQQFLLKTL